MKKIVSLVLALSMVLSMFATAFAGTALKDVAETDYEAAVSALVELGIVAGYEDGTYQPNKVVTRAEMAKLLVISAGLEPAADVSKGATNFSDVAASHWASGYINVASQYGYINGYPSGTFAPDATVTYAEAVTMAIRVLGYKTVVEAKGTWPTNYIAKAQELKVLKDVDYKSYSEGATRGNVALLIWNMLRTDMWDVESENESNGLTYSDFYGVTMIDKYFEDYIYIDEDVEARVVGIAIDEDGEVTLDLSAEGKVVPEDFKTVDGCEIAKDVDFLNLFGRRVSILYNEEDEVAVMVIPSADDKLKEDYIFDLEEDNYDMTGASTKTWGTSGASENELDYVYGVIESKKEIAYATVYETSADSYIVEEIEEAKDGIDLVEIGGETLFVDEDAIVIIDGEYATAEDIKVGDVVTVLEVIGQEEEIILCAVAREKVTGSFDSLTEKKDFEDEVYFVKVDGKQYDVSLAVVENVVEIDEDGDELQLEVGTHELVSILNDDESKFYDEECTLFLNFLGEVIRIEFEEVKDAEADGEFYVLTNIPATWEVADKSGVTRYIELNGESYEVKASAEDMASWTEDLYDGLDDLAKAASSNEEDDANTERVVFVRFDSKDRVVDLRVVDGSDIVDVENNEFNYSFAEITDKLDDNNYINGDSTTGIKVNGSTVVYTITPVKDDEDDFVGYDVEIAKGAAAVKGIETGIIAIDAETPNRAAYIFVYEDAKNTENTFAIIEAYEVENGKVYLTVNGKRYEVDEDDENKVAKSDVKNLVAYTINEKILGISKVYAIDDIVEDDLVLTVDGELFTTARTNGDFDVIAEESGDYAVVLAKVKKNTAKGIYEFNTVKNIELSEIKLDKEKDFVVVFEEDVDGVAAIMVIEGYKIETAPTTYTITWMNGETELEVDTEVEADANPSYDGVEPTKAATAEFTYEFAGWAVEDGGEKLETLPAVTEDATYYAVFTATPVEPGV